MGVDEKIKRKDRSETRCCLLRKKNRTVKDDEVKVTGCLFLMFIEDKGFVGRLCK